MKRLLVAMLCVATAGSLLAGGNSYKVTYDGGSLPDLKSGTGMQSYIEQDKIRLVKDGKELASIPRQRSPISVMGKTFTGEWVAQ